MPHAPKYPSIFIPQNTQSQNEIQTRNVHAACICIVIVLGILLWLLTCRRIIICVRFIKMDNFSYFSISLSFIPNQCPFDDSIQFRFFLWTFQIRICNAPHWNTSHWKTRYCIPSLTSRLQKKWSVKEEKTMRRLTIVQMKNINQILHELSKLDQNYQSSRN